MVGLIFLLVLVYVQNFYVEVTLVKAALDGNRYVVQNLDDRQRAAELLAALTADMTRLVRHVKAKHPADPDVQRLYRNFNPRAVSEGSMENGFVTSYSINKGEKIVMCIRQTDRSFVDGNVVRYVAVHELAHLMTSEHGHTDLFWKNFRFLLKSAMDIGVYKQQDFAKQPQAYCGMTISSSVV